MGEFVDMGDMIFDKAGVKWLLVDFKYLLRRECTHEGKVGIDITFLVTEMFVELENFKIRSCAHDPFFSFSH
jgi:hypothetical protein